MKFLGMALQQRGSGIELQELNEPTGACAESARFVLFPARQFRG
jgi:hypothetical protein